MFERIGNDEENWRLGVVLYLEDGGCESWWGLRKVDEGFDVFEERGVDWEVEFWMFSFFEIRIFCIRVNFCLVIEYVRVLGNLELICIVVDDLREDIVDFRLFDFIFFINIFWWGFFLGVKVDEYEVIDLEIGVVFGKLLEKEVE